MDVSPLGQSDFVDSAYFAVLLGFTALGVWWLSRYLARYNLPPRAGAAFLLVPAVLISLDRATVDVALAALCVGFALYAVAEPSPKIYAILALAPLARETGACLIASFVLCASRAAMVRRRPGLAGRAAVPGWLLFLDAHTKADHTIFASLLPLKGLVVRTIHPIQYGITSAWLKKAAALDYLAVLGIWAALMASPTIGFRWMNWKPRPWPSRRRRSSWRSRRPGERRIRSAAPCRHCCCRWRWQAYASGTGLRYSRWRSCCRGSSFN